VVHLVSPATAATAEAAASPAATSAGRFGPEPRPPVVRAAVIGGHGRISSTPRRRFLVAAAVPHLPAYTGYVPPEVGVQPAVQQRVGARGRHGHHVDDRERLVQRVRGVDQVRLELDEQREQRQRKPAEREHHRDRRQYPHCPLVPTQLSLHCKHAQKQNKKK